MRYETLEVVSRGGQGVVYRARDRETDQIVALKVYGPPREGSIEPRLERELEATGRLDHPGVVKVLGAEMRADEPAIAMQWIDGIQIDVWAKRCGPGRDAMRRKLQLFIQVCDAVRHAHQRGVLHRDLKPSNILVDGEDQPHVVDFGIAQVFRDETLRSRDSLGLAGTPSFLAPEILLESVRAANVRSEVYALGSVLFVVLTGRTPFPPTHDLADMIHAVETSEPARLSNVNPAFARDLDHVVAKALAMDSSARYQSVPAFAADLQRYLRGEPVDAHPPSAWYRLRKTARRHPASCGFAVAIAALALVYAVTSVLHALDLSVATKRAEAAAIVATNESNELAHVVGEFRFLLNAVRLTRAREEAASFFPADPARIVDMERWLADEAEPLAASLPRALSARDALREVALPWSEADREDDRHGHPDFDELEILQHHLDVMHEDLAGPADDDDAAAKGLRAQLENYEERVASMRADVDRRRTYRFDQQRDAYRYDALTRLVTDLKSFTAEDGVLARVRDQLAWTRQIDELSLHRPAEAWQHAVAAIERNPAYGGLRISPQRGLVPLGPDPRSGLWEFLHLRSAAPGSRAQARSASGQIEVDGDTGVVFVLLPGGEFSMGTQDDDPAEPNYDPRELGDQRPMHDVRLDPFFLAKHETTQGQWRRLSFGGEPSFYQPGFDASWLNTEPVEQYDWSNPVESVSWLECVDVLGGHGLLLPTEAQWEYACRAGTTTRWSTGETSDTLAGHANVADACLARLLETGADRSLNDGYVFHAPIGSYAPNPFGLHDTLGNVAEWCRDSLLPYREPARPGDGLRGDSGSHPLSCGIRGGSYATPPAVMATVYRAGSAPDSNEPSLGVRAARRLDR